MLKPLGGDGLDEERLNRMKSSEMKLEVVGCWYSSIWRSVEGSCVDLLGERVIQLTRGRARFKHGGI